MPVPASGAARPRVSVITPVHNQAEFLPRAAGSLAAQDAPAWEHLIIDDGSDDATPEVVARLAAADPRVRTCRLPRNSGMPAAANVGLDHARGDLIA